MYSASNAMKNLKNLYLTLWDTLDIVITLIMITSVFYILRTYVFPAFLSEDTNSAMQHLAVWVVPFFITLVICIQLGGIPLMKRVLPMVFETGEHVKYRWSHQEIYSGNTLSIADGTLLKINKEPPPSRYAKAYLDPEEHVWVALLLTNNEERKVPLNYITSIV